MFFFVFVAATPVKIPTGTSKDAKGMLEKLEEVQDGTGEIYLLSF